MKINVLSGDEQRANEKVDCFNYCRIHGERAFMAGDLKTAADYFNKATKCLQDLNSMQEARLKLEDAWLKLKQINGEQQMRDLINSIRPVGFVPRKDYKS